MLFLFAASVAATSVVELLALESATFLLTPVSGGEMFLSFVDYLRRTTNMSEFQAQMRFGLRMRQHFDALRALLSDLKHGDVITVEESSLPDDCATGFLTAQALSEGLPILVASSANASFFIPQNDGTVRYLRFVRR